jgi:hypothetical protein
MLDALVFEEQPLVPAVSAYRADIALFIGCVARRSTHISGELCTWLKQRGWTRLRPTVVKDLLDVPVPIAGWDTFDQLFAWEQRPLDGSGQFGTTYLGAAVRSFFAQGGRQCYVVRVGDPWPLNASREARRSRMSDLVPGYPWRFDASTADQSSWRGAGHLYGLDDVAMICLPDLADALAADRLPPHTSREIPTTPEVFVECSEDEPADIPDGAVRRFHAPRCDEQGYAEWSRAINLLASAVAQQRRDVQIVAALPLPIVGTSGEHDPLGMLAGTGPLAYALDEHRNGIASAFVQIVYPWVRTTGAGGLPEGLESPDGLIAGVLAKSILSRGAYRSIVGETLGDLYDVEPQLSRAALLQRRPDTDVEGAARHALIERVSIIGTTPAGWRLLSDVTTSLDEHYRPAALNRLMAELVRAARTLGDDMVFESSGERTWARVRQGIESLLLRLLHDGALRGATPAEAFTVRCDRTTMSQNDIDNGRMVVNVSISPAAPIEQITVVLALSAGGQVALIR